MKKVVLLLIFTIYSFALNILILNSYSSTIAWTNSQSNEDIKILKKMNLKNGNIYVEFMDTKRFKPTKEYFNLYFNFFKNKYKNIQFDIVITTDDNALNFIRKYKNSFLFVKSKVFFQGINNLTLKNKLDKNIYAGVFEKKEPLLQLKLAKTIIPNLKVVYVISDNSVSGNKIFAQYRNKYKNIKNIKFVYIHSNNFNEIVNKLKDYDKNSIVMLLTFYTIKRYNHLLIPSQFEKELSKIYKNPMLVHSDVLAYSNDSNVVGGVCTDAKIQSILNMKKVQEYLNGTPMKKIGFQENYTNRLYINVKNAQKLGMDIDKFKIEKLPIELVNKPTTFYEIYKYEIWTGIIILILIILFIIILAQKNRELYLYSKKIEDINKNLEKKVQEAVEENTKHLQMLQQQSKLAAMGEMIGMIAHQWRQPLNALAIKVQLIPEILEEENCDEKVIEKGYDFSRDIMKTINFMSHTIDDFRNFFKKDNEKIEFDISEAIEETLNLQKEQLKNHNIEVMTNLNPIKIIGFKNEFKQVILNLINNAKDAIIENKKKGIIKISDYEHSGNIVIIIEDNGGGIKEEILDKIFEPYFSTKSKQGTGLGLYMSNEIIKRINGQIEVKNSEEGAKFIITIRRKKNEK